MHGRDIGATQRRPTEEEAALSERLHQRGKVSTRLDEKKAEIEKRFSELYQAKKHYIEDKHGYVAGLETEQRLALQNAAEREELERVNDEIVHLGGMIAARNLDSCEGIPALYARSKELSASIDRTIVALQQARLKIERHAPGAAKFDQVVTLITQMNEFFTQLNAALNGVLDLHTLPSAEAE
ncbi:MAG: hypothetical protein NTX63_01675 [Candidatus Peregrinibacteria bacterium]|nr:hypothetical protein [Candidatus Peregrinibacteria bacterium]